MIKKIIRIYINSFKYSRRLIKLHKSLNILLKELDRCSGENRTQLYETTLNLHIYARNLLNEFSDYIEINKFKGDKHVQ